MRSPLNKKQIPIEPLNATVQYWALDIAVQRFKFRNPAHEWNLFIELSQYDQNCIIKEALEIGAGK